MKEVQVTGPALGFLWQKNIHLYIAGAKQARHSELMAFHESWSWRLRLEGSGGLAIALMASGLQQAGHQIHGDRKSSGLSDVVSHDCLFGKRKPCRENWGPSPPPEKESQLVQVLPSSPTCHGTHIHTGAWPLVTAPYSVHPGEVSLPCSKRNNRAPEHCCLHFYPAFAAKDPTLLSLLLKS